jgi:protein-L-isoaspartate(D-aspartate) O-methyltransferase
MTEHHSLLSDREAEQRYARERAALLSELRQEFAATADVTGWPELGSRVADAMAAVPRHEFVPDELRRFAYENRPLPIGDGQTISQPYIVALMTELLAPCLHDRILEIGTGSGYQAAILARLAKQVYSVEVIPDLAFRATATFARLGIANVSVRVGDGSDGWPEHAPYDGIIVTAAAAQMPPALLEQLTPGGRMVIPIDYGEHQELVLVTRTDEGEVVRREILPVAFVPLVQAGDAALDPTRVSQ